MTTARQAAPKPFPYISPHSPLLHSGVVAVPAGGSLVVDLGLKHNDFVPTVSEQTATPAAGHFVSWTYGTLPGTFVIYTSGAMSVSFTAIAGASVA